MKIQNKTYTKASKKHINYKFNEISNNKSIHYRINKINCPTCKANEIFQISGKLFGICEICNTKFIFFIPNPIQQMIINDTMFMKILYGSVGTGKTAVDAHIVFQHITSIPFARVGVIANTMDQINRTAKNELMKYFDKSDFIKYNNENWTLKNGSEILWLTSDDPQKIKSLNLTGGWGLEVDSMNEEVIKELVRRIRHQSAVVYEYKPNGQPLYVISGAEYIPKMKYNKWFLLLEANISNSYLNEYIICSTKIFYTPNVDIEAYPAVKNRRKIHSYILSLYDCNLNGYEYLEKIKQLCVNRDEERKVLNCNISKASSVLFPNLYKNITEPFNVNTQDYIYFSATDFGANIGYTTFLVFAFNLTQKIWYLVYEYGVIGRPFKENIANFTKIMQEYNKGLWVENICDSAGKQTLIVEGSKSLLDIAKNLGMNFKPIPKNTTSKQEGINFLNYLIDKKELFIFNNCINTIDYLTTAIKYKNTSGKYSFKSTISKLRDDWFDSMVYAGNYLSENYFKGKWMMQEKKIINIELPEYKPIRWIY